MLTPAFDIIQDETFITITIRAPYARISEAEIFIEETDFRFHSKPYFLRLTLPGAVVEDGREQANYDTDSGKFKVKIPKKTPGEIFEGLDMLTKLLAPTGSTSIIQPGIEILSETGELDTREDDAEEDDEDFDWQIEQCPYTEELQLSGAPTYGFANQKSGVFKRLQEEIYDVIDLMDADVIPAQSRGEKRLANEDSVFDEEHYMADFSDEDAIIKQLVNFKTEWHAQYILLLKGQDPHDFVKLTEDEKDIMRKLPRKEYLLDARVRQQLYLSLVDIMFGFMYNLHITEGENTVESAWCVCKLSGTLSWLQTFSSIDEVVRGCYRSALCYPLYRHWGLAKSALEDVYHILKLGRRSVLKCLLQIRSILAKNESKYVLNDLYITDYCVWIQSASNKRLSSLADSLKQVNVMKEDVGFELDILEQACELAVSESRISKEIPDGQKEDQLTASFKSLHLKGNTDEANGANQLTTESTSGSESGDDSSESSETDSSEAESSETEVTESGENGSETKSIEQDDIEIKENEIKSSHTDKIREINFTAKEKPLVKNKISSNCGHLPCGNGGVRTQKDNISGDSQCDGGSQLDVSENDLASDNGELLCEKVQTLSVSVSKESKDKSLDAKSLNF